MTEPVLGWRIWRLRSWRLESWAVEYCWQPGENRARCLARNRPPCDASPGQHCQCGFWALRSPRHCLARADGDSEPRWHVMGLIAGWGTVALHGEEGFRAERVAIRCLFTDWPAGGPASPGARSRLVRWWRGRTGRPADLDLPPGPMEDPRRWSALQNVAARYAVPLVPLQGAADFGLLAELGVPPGQVEEARVLGAASTTGQSGRHRL